MRKKLIFNEPVDHIYTAGHFAVTANLDVIFEGSTHTVVDSTYGDESLAIARCAYMAKVYPTYHDATSWQLRKAYRSSKNL